MNTLFVSALELYVLLTLCSFMCCIGAEQCGVMVTVSSQDNYLASLNNMMANFKAKCRKKSVVPTVTVPASSTTETSMTSEKDETSTNPATTSVTTTQLMTDTRKTFQFSITVPPYWFAYIHFSITIFSFRSFLIVTPWRASWIPFVKKSSFPNSYHH